MWKLWNLPANKVKRGDFDCDCSLRLFHDEGTKSIATAQNVSKQIKNGLELSTCTCLKFYASYLQL